MLPKKHQSAIIAKLIFFIKCTVPIKRTTMDGGSMKLFLLIFLAVLFCLPFTVSAEIYKWVDENGNMQFSDTPPSTQRAEALEYHYNRGDEDGGKKKVEKSTRVKPKSKSKSTLDDYLAEEESNRKKKAAEKRSAEQQKHRAEHQSKLSDLCKQKRDQVMNYTRRAGKARMHGKHQKSKRLSNKARKIQQEISRSCSGY